MKLSAAKADIIRSMRNGSELTYDAFTTEYFLDKNKVQYSEIENLRALGIVMKFTGNPVLKLTELGKRIEL